MKWIKTHVATKILEETQGKNPTLGDLIYLGYELGYEHGKGEE